MGGTSIYIIKELGETRRERKLQERKSHLKIYVAFKSKRSQSNDCTQPTVIVIIIHVHIASCCYVQRLLFQRSPEFCHANFFQRKKNFKCIYHIHSIQKSRNVDGDYVLRCIKIFFLNIFMARFCAHAHKQVLI